MKKRILIVLLIFSLIFPCITLTFQKETEAINVKSWLGKGLFYVLNKASNKFYSVKASVSVGKYGSTITPGSLYFNNGKVGTSVKYPVYAQAKGHSVAMYFTSAPSNWGKRMSLILTNSSGRDVINKSVTPEQYKGYKFPKKERYVARFVVSPKIKAAPYIAYRYDGANGVYRSLLPEIGPTRNADENSEYIEGYGDVVAAMWNEEKKKTDKVRLNVFELFEQMRDDEGKFVYSMRNYTESDVITISDTIKELKYDKEDNETVFLFTSGQTEEYGLRFNGDLTSKYKKGQNFVLKFDVISLGDNKKYSVPEYFKYLIDNEGKAPTISSYVVK